MKICLVNAVENETIMEHESPFEDEALVAANEYYKLDEDGRAMPVFVRRLRGEALDRIFRHVKNKYPKES
jgi:hypothetical protein